MLQYLILVITIWISSNPLINAHYAFAEGEYQTEPPCATNTRINQAVFSLDGKYIFSTWDIGSAKLWSAETGKVVHTFSIGSGIRVLTIAFSPNGKYVITGGAEGVAILWDIQTGEKVRSFSPDIKQQKYMYDITSIAFTPDNKYILTGDYTGGRLWDLKTGQQLHFFAGGDTQTDKVYLSSDGTHVLTVDSPHIKLWDTQTGQMLHDFDGSQGGFSTDSQSILIWSDGLSLYSVNTFQKSMFFPEPAPWQFSRDDHYLLTYPGDMIILWEISTGEKLHTWNFEKNNLNKATFLPNNRYLLVTDDTSHGDGDPKSVLKIWDIKADGELQRFSVSRPFSNVFEVSPDNKYLLIGETGLYIWDINSGKQLRQLC